MCKSSSRRKSARFFGWYSIFFPKQNICKSRQTNKKIVMHLSPSQACNHECYLALSLQSALSLYHETVEVSAKLWINWPTTSLRLFQLTFSTYFFSVLFSFFANSFISKSFRLKPVHVIPFFLLCHYCFEICIYWLKLREIYTTTTFKFSCCHCPKQLLYVQISIFCKKCDSKIFLT